MSNERFIRPASNLITEETPADVEVTELRRWNGKTFDLGGGNFRTRTMFGAVHYKADPTDDREGWKEIDLAIGTVDGKVGAAPYDVEIFKDRVGYSYTSKRGGRVDVELVEVGALPVAGKVTGRFEGNQAFWDGVGGVDFKLVLGAQSAEIYKLLKDDTVPRRFLWRVREDVDSEAGFRPSTFGRDADGNALEMTTAVSGEKTVPSVDRTYREFLYEEVWTGRVSRKADPKTRRKDWYDDPVYPVVIDATTQENIEANADDGFEYGTQFLISSGGSKLFFGFYNGDENAGFRFQTLGVPQGATINTATITLNVMGGGSSTQAKIYADDVDDAAAWANDNRPSQITKTTANVSWSPTAPTGTHTIGVTSVVQEIISRGGWSSGNDIRFAFLNQVTGGNSSISISDYAGGQANAAVLDVDYSTGVTAVDVFDDNANLVSLWKLEEASGTRDDAVGSNDLADNNTVGQSADQKEGTYSADFEAGNSEFLSIADNAGLSITGSLSIVCWVKAETLPGNMNLVNKYEASGNQRSYYAWIRDDSSTFYPRINVSSNGTAYTGAQADTGLSTATWYHLAFVYDGTDLRVYVDGALDMTPVAYSSGIYDGTAALELGRYPDDSEYYDGLMDEVALFNDALTAGEVKGIFESGIQAAAGGVVPVMMYDYRRMRV